MANEVRSRANKHPRWSWKEGTVDVRREHIKLLYGNSEKQSWEDFKLVALIAPPKRQTFLVQFMLDSDDRRQRGILDQIKKEINFYLIEKGERNPWDYAIYHCSSAANVYSLIHWAHCRNTKITGGEGKGMNHSECVRKLIEAGTCLGFKAVGRSSGKKYELGNPDCVWYYTGKGQEVFSKIARGEKARFLPFVAFEVAYSEKEKNLRGSLVTLQLTNASASIIVLLGNSVEQKEFLKKLLGRYSFGRFRLWLEEDVNEMYDRVMKK